MVGLSRK